MTPTEADRSSDSSGRASLFSEVWWLPRFWVLAMGAIAILAALQIGRDANGTITAEVQFGVASLVALGLIWFPTLMRLIVYTGASFKTAQFEASVPGLLSEPEAFKLRLASAQVATSSDAGERLAATQKLMESVDQITQPVLEGSDLLTDAALVELARRYERTRSSEPGSSERIMKLDRIVAEVRARASAAPDRAAARARDLLISESEGERVVALGIVQEAGDRRLFDALINLIEHPRTRFEMYHAQLALRKIRTTLFHGERKRAIEVLTALKHERRLGIGPDSNSYALIEENLLSIRGYEAERSTRPARRPGKDGS